jgi:uncharacterized membrane protein
MQQVLDYVTLVIGSLAGLIIIYGIVLGLIELVKAELRSFRATQETSVVFERIRYDIGFHLLLGLEFLIAADVIRTILRPTLEELAILGSIVAIRTVISYFLGKEINQKSERKTGR